MCVHDGVLCVLGVGEVDALLLTRLYKELVGPRHLPLHPPPPTCAYGGLRHALNEGHGVDVGALGQGQRLREAPNRNAWGGEAAWCGFVCVYGGCSEAGLCAAQGGWFRRARGLQLLWGMAGSMLLWVLQQLAAWPGRTCAHPNVLHLCAHEANASASAELLQAPHCVGVGA